VSGERPLLRVVRGAPSDAELAALTTVLLAAAARGAAGSPPAARRSAWADRSALMRHPPHPGPGAWRAAAAPR